MTRVLDTGMDSYLVPFTFAAEPDASVIVIRMCTLSPLSVCRNAS
jgi:hypothetical protein